MPRPQPIPRSLAKKRKPSAADGLPEGMEGLSDSERELLSRMVGKKAPEPKRETVPKADHDREVASLNERISKLESKIEEIQKDKAKVVEERDSARRSLETARAKVEELEGRLESKSSDLRAAGERIAKLETKVSSLESDRGTALESAMSKKDEEIAKVSKRASKTEDELAECNRTLTERDARISELEERVSELESEIEKAESTECIGEMSLMETPSVMSEEPRIGSVSRISADTLESPLFEDGRYRVNLSRDGRYIRFTRDVTGTAVAEKGRMRLPMLGRYVEFRSESELPAYGEDNEFRVLLDR